jgi:hypothetical protein
MREKPELQASVYILRTNYPDDPIQQNNCGNNRRDRAMRITPNKANRDICFSPALHTPNKAAETKGREVRIKTLDLLQNSATATI